MKYSTFGFKKLLCLVSFSLGVGGAGAMDQHSSKAAVAGEMVRGFIGKALRAGAGAISSFRGASDDGSARATAQEGGAKPGRNSEWDFASGKEGLDSVIRDGTWRPDEAQRLLVTYNYDHLIEYLTVQVNQKRSTLAFQWAQEGASRGVVPLSLFCIYHLAPTLCAGRMNPVTVKEFARDILIFLMFVQIDMATWFKKSGELEDGEQARVYGVYLSLKQSIFAAVKESGEALRELKFSDVFEAACCEIEQRKSNALSYRSFLWLRMSAGLDPEVINPTNVFYKNIPQSMIVSELGDEAITQIFFRRQFEGRDSYYAYVVNSMRTNVPQGTLFIKFMQGDNNMPDTWFASLPNFGSRAA